MQLGSAASATGNQDGAVAPAPASGPVNSCETSGIPEGALQSLEAARQLVERAARVTVLTGAGISTDSGIPDFRGPNGVWTKDPKAEVASTLQAFLTDPAVRRACWQRLPSMLTACGPNRGHRALLELQRTGKLQLLVTQNVDGLHQAAGHLGDKLVEVHGSHTHVRCLYCFTRHPARRLLNEHVPTLNGQGAAAREPRCPRCCGMLKPDVVFFGEALPEGAIERAFGAARECGVLLCVGTTLSVLPVCKMVAQAKAAGAQVVILNGSPTEMDSEADVIVRAPIAAALPTIVGLAGGSHEGTISEGCTGTAEEDDAPTWEDHGFGLWLQDAKLLADMDRVAADAWMDGIVPDWPPAVYHGASNPMFTRVGV